MNTEVIKLDYEKIDSEKIKKAGQIIKDGGLVAFPTETVYGLGGDGLNGTSSQKIYAAKGRPSDNPLIVHIARMEDLEKLTTEVSQKAKDLMKTFWPGPLTLIFKKTELVPSQTTGGLATVAVRYPNDVLAQEFIKAAGGFVAGPSANVSGRPSPTLAAHVKEDLDGRIEAILDGGQAVIGLESTIVDVSEDQPMILRPGIITKEMIEAVIGKLEIDRAILDPNSGEKPKAPGMKYRHYAPKAELTIVEGKEKFVLVEIEKRIQEAKKQGKKVGVLATDETKTYYKADVTKSIGSRACEEEVGMHLYEVLREFDETDVDEIYSESFSDMKIGAAIMNRLLKAAGHKMIKLT